jgi:hypothetical protein
MKSTVKLLLITVLFTSAAFAEGEMGSNGKTCPTGSTCLTETPPPAEGEPTTTESDDTILTYVQKYLESMVEYFADPQQ